MESTAMIDNKAKVKYQDFEPYCAWLRGEESDTLAVHLPGFTTEQIRVQANNQRILVIYGQRPVVGEADTWTRFSKHVKLPEDCDENRISAKFVSGVLTITMHKKDKLVTSMEVISDQETRESIDNLERKSGNCVIKRATDCGKDEERDSVKGLLTMAGKVVAVVLVIAVSGAYVHARISKKRTCNVEN